MKRLFWVAVGAVGATSGTRWVKRKASDAAEQYRPVEVGLRTARTMAARVDAARRDGRSARLETETRLRGRLLGADVRLLEGEPGATVAIGAATPGAPVSPVLDGPSTTPSASASAAPDPASDPWSGAVPGGPDGSGSHGRAGARRRRRPARRR
jgi:hypothetical protein